MTNEEVAKRNYRLLLDFFQNKIPVHVETIHGIFYNGYILSLDFFSLNLVIMDRRNGRVPILLEDLKFDKITEFRGKLEESR